jgi:hypothetical protein
MAPHDAGAILLSIGHLTRLGKLPQRFTFVADYEELEGYSVNEAVRKLGGQIADSNHVSAIVFPRKSEIYPANARGLLQVIQRLANRVRPETNIDVQ